MKGYASLDAGLIARRYPPPQPAEPLSPDLVAALEDRAPHEDAPHQLDAEGHHQAPSVSLTADLISAGRAAYRAERQRQAQKTDGLSTRGEMLGVLQFRPAPQRAGMPTLRDVASMTLRDVAISVLPRPLRPAETAQPAPPSAGPFRSLVPSRPEPARLAAPAREAPGRRRAVTLRLRPEQHARLLTVRRQLGCSFQVLVVRALTDHLDAVARDPSAATRAGDDHGDGKAISSGDLGAALAADAGRHGHKVPDLHYFTLPNGWSLVAWRQQRGGDAATPSEVLGNVLKERGVAELFQANGGSAAESVLESVSLGDGGHRLALTIRLDPELHGRLQAAREKLGRSGQDILLDSINAYLEA